MQILLDVSEFQSTSQLETLLHHAPDEIVGVYIKATQGLSYRDEVAGAFAKVCNAHNTPFGYYDYLTNDQAAEQAEYFQSFVSRMPKAAMAPLLDCEGSYAKYAEGVEHWRAAIGGNAVVYAQLSNMVYYRSVNLPKIVAQYDKMGYYRPSVAEIQAYQQQGYLGWQFTSNYIGLNQDASILLGDFSLLRAL